MKNKEISSKKEMLGMVVCLIIFFSLFFFVMAKYHHKLRDTNECLEPLAKEICDERNLNYVSNNEEVVRCKEDIRIRNAEIFNFNMEEKNNCQFDFWTGEKK